MNVIIETESSQIFNRQEWLKSLNIGDAVISRDIFNKENMEIIKVSDKTQNGRIIINDNILLDENGYTKGSYKIMMDVELLYEYYIEPLTDELKKQINRKKMLWYIEDIDISKLDLPYEQLKVIYNILWEAKHK